MLVKNCFIATILSCNIFWPAHIQASSYTTSAFAWQKHHLQSLTWVFDSLINERDFSFTYQTYAQTPESSLWKTLPLYECQAQQSFLFCHAPLPSDLENFLQFRLTYPDNVQLQNLNYHFDTPTLDSTDQIETNRQLFYSNFKTVDEQTKVEYISWQELNLIASPSSTMIVQTRASYDQTHWTGWVGNSTTLLPKDDNSHFINEKADFEATEGSILLHNLPSANFDYLHLSYLPLASPYQLTTPATMADQENEAFQQLSFHLNTLTDLQLGETLLISESVKNELHQIKGIISDLKPQENLVSVFAWQGAIPYQLPALCQDHHFCFTTQAEVQKITEEFLPADLYLNAQEKTVSLPFLYQDILSLDFVQALPPLCLDEIEKQSDEILADDEVICQNYGYSLSAYYQNEKSPLTLQYRLIYHDPKDKIITQVYLHQKQNTTSHVHTNLYRLRGGKIFNSNWPSRPYYWH